MTKLEEWRLEQGYTYRRLAEALDITEETARRYCLPRGHKLARSPAPSTLRAIEKLTSGAVKPSDYDQA